jgi:hypothetical protein
VLAAIVASCFGLTSAGAQTLTQGNTGNNASKSSNKVVAQAGGMAPADFGTAPSGEVPILFNDRHVYSKPDTLKQNRVLAALVRGNTVLIPLRSMFEQMGATVAYDPGTKTATVTKPGSSVSVTVGKPEVVINGETRPLDVPPEIYKGAVVVPIRVLSEGMGAYVQWVPEKKTVVVRYVAAAPPPPPSTPPPATPPPVVATPVSTPVPTPTPKPKVNRSQYFVAADYIFDPKVYNEFSPGSTGGASYHAKAGAVVDLFGLAILAEGDGRQYNYPHRGSTAFDNNSNAGYFGGPPVCGPGGAAVGDQGCVTAIGGAGQSFVPSFDAKDSDIDGRLGIGIPFPRVFIGVSYITRWDNYGYPREQGFGYGVEKIPDFEGGFAPYGSFYYYPQVGAGNEIQYSMYKYEGGLALGLKKETGIPLFLEGGYVGDKGFAKLNAPGGFAHNGFEVGLGLHF